MVSYKTNFSYNLSCLQQTYHCLSTNKKLLVSWQFSGTYGVTKYGSGWRKDVINQCLEFVLSRAVFRSRAPSWRPFLLKLTDLSHTRQITYEVWGFHVTDGDVCSDWGECNGCFCWGGSGNNWPSIDDFYSAKICACRAISLPRMRKIICAEKEPGPPQEATPQTGWWTSFPLFTVWSEIYHVWWSTLLYEQCSIHLKKKTLSVRRAKDYLHTRETLSQGSIHAR